MARVRLFTPENRLGRVLESSDGRPLDEMAQDAEERVAALGPRLAAFVEEQVDTILALGLRNEELVFADCREIAEAALRVAEVAGSAGLHAIGDAARGIRAMIEGLFTGGIWHSDALRLHFEALALLVRGPPQSKEEMQRIIDRLTRLRSRIGLLD